MEIKSASIYGFGKWVHFDIDLDRGICIYGENESGKSSLHQFILFMLFGLPPKQRAFYRPKTGGVLGGRMTIHDKEMGEFTIERIDNVKNGAATCFTPDGSEWDEEWLSERLKGTTLTTYQSIFSFSAMDLGNITEMKDVDLGEVLLGIGLTGSTEIYKIEKQLENKLGELFKPYGKKPRINQQLDRLEKRFSLLIEYKQGEATYREKKTNELYVQKKLGDLQEAWSNEKRQLSKLQKHMQALPIISDYNQYKSRLQAYEKNSVFPENGVARLENLKEVLLPLKSELVVLKDNGIKMKQKLDQIHREQVDHETYETATYLLKEKQSFLANQKELEQLENSIQSKRMEIEMELERWDIGLKLDDIFNIPLPFHLEKTWTEIKNNIERITYEKEKAANELHQLKQERNHLYNRLEKLEEHLLSNDEMIELNDKWNMSQKTDVVQKLQEEAKQKKKSWNKRKKQKEKNINRFLLVCLAFAILFSIVGLVTKIDWLPIIGILMLLLGVGQWTLGKRSLKDLQEWQTMSVPSIESPLTIEEKQNIEAKLASHGKQMKDMENVKEQLEQNDIKRFRVRERLKDIKEKEHNVQKKHDAQIREYPFLQYMDSYYWPEFYHKIKQLISRTKAYMNDVRDKEKLEKKLDEYIQNVNNFFRDNHWESSDFIDDQLDAMESLVLKQQERIQQFKHYSELHLTNEQDQSEVVRRIHTYEEELKKLYDAAEVDSEEAFYQKAKEIEEKAQLKDAIRKTIGQLERLFPNGLWKDYIDKDKTEIEIEWKWNESEKRVKDLEENIVEAERELVRIQSELELMESQEEYSNNLHQFEMEQEDLNQLAKEWATIKLAKDLLMEAKRGFMEKHLKQVVEKTAIYFSRLTGYKYKQIFAPSENTGFLVETRDGIRYKVSELSKGTMDQLYVSLRLAIGQVLSAENQLPFIIDDAFLHFDSVRTQRIVEILEEIAETRQVIFFTCKEDVAEATNRLKKVDLEKSIRII